MGSSSSFTTTTSTIITSMRTQLLSWTLLAASSAFASPLSTYPYVPKERYPDYSLAPLHVASVPAHNLINDSYIVMFKDGFHPTALDSHFNLLDNAFVQNPLESVESGIKHVWFNSHVKGYAGTFSREVVDMIRRRPEVDYVEHDQVVHTLETQKSAPWVRSPVSATSPLLYT